MENVGNGEARALGGTGGSPVASGGSPEVFRAANPHGESRAEAVATAADARREPRRATGGSPVPPGARRFLLRSRLHGDRRSRLKSA